MDRYFPGGKLSLEADYYAGCYRFRRRITQTAIDVGAATRVLSKIQGLNVNYLDNSLCCYVPPHMEKLGSCLKTKTIINICTGCYHSMHRSLQHKGEYSLKMLPEVVWESIEVK